MLYYICTMKKQITAKDRERKKKKKMAEWLVPDVTISWKSERILPIYILKPPSVVKLYNGM